MIETIEKIQARHEKELADAQKISAVSAELPIAADGIMSTYSDQYWITHKAKTADDIVKVIRAYSHMIVPTTEYRDGCLYRVPIDLMPQRIRASATEKGNDVVFSLDVDQGRGFGPCVEFWFYAKTKTGIYLKVKCDLPNNYRLSADMKRPDYDRRGDCLGNGQCKPNNILNSIFDKYIAWSPNMRGVDARYTYTLCDDAPDYRAAIDIMQNSPLSDVLGGTHG